MRGVRSSQSYEGAGSNWPIAHVAAGVGMQQQVRQQAGTQIYAGQQKLAGELRQMC
jgi:hypothetical protein